MKIYPADKGLCIVLKVYGSAIIKKKIYKIEGGMEETSVIDKHVEEVIHTSSVVDTDVGKQLIHVTETDAVTET